MTNAQILEALESMLQTWGEDIDELVGTQATNGRAEKLYHYLQGQIATLRQSRHELRQPVEKARS